MISMYNSFLKLDNNQVDKIFGKNLLPKKMTFEFKTQMENALLFYSTDNMISINCYLSTLIILFF